MPAPFEDEADLMAMLRASIVNQHGRQISDVAPAGSRLSLEARRALADVAEAVRDSRSAALDLRPAA